MIYNELMAIKRLSSAPVRKLAEDRGVDNPYALAREAGISYPTARAWWFDEEMGRIDVPTLIKLVEYFEVDWCDLLEVVEDTI